MPRKFDHAIVNKGAGRASAADRIEQVLTMRPYIAVTGMALGLMAVWAALVPFVT
jgi:hypothetical protein